MVDNEIILALIGAGVGVIALMGKLIYSSKCSSVKCCCCEVQRDVQHEETVSQISMQPHPPTSPRVDAV